MTNIMEKAIIDYLNKWELSPADLTARELATLKSEMSAKYVLDGFRTLRNMMRICSRTEHNVIPSVNRAISQYGLTFDDFTDEEQEQITKAFFDEGKAETLTLQAIVKRYRSK